jgi:DNA-binding CsgD family transcriptional regulator
MMDAILFLLLIFLLIGWIGVFEIPFCLSSIRHSGMMNSKVFNTLLLSSCVIGGLLCIGVTQPIPVCSKTDIYIFLISVLLTLFVLKSFGGTSSFIPAVLGAFAAMGYQYGKTFGLLPMKYMLLSLILPPILCVLFVYLLDLQVSRQIRVSNKHLLIKSRYCFLVLAIGVIFGGAMMVYNYALVILPLLSVINCTYDIVYLVGFILALLVLFAAFLKTPNRVTIRCNSISYNVSILFGIALVLFIFNILLPLLHISQSGIIVPVTQVAIAGTMVFEKDRLMQKIRSVAMGIIVVPALTFLFSMILYRLYAQVILLIFSIFVFITVVVFVKLFVRQFQQNKMIMSALEDSRLRRSEIHGEMNRLDMASVTSQFDVLSNKMEMKRKELMSLALHIKHQHDSMEEFSNKLTDIYQTDGEEEIKKKLKDMIFDMQNSMKFNKEMDMFYTQVDELHKSFVSKLMTVCPTLTEQEKRLAIFLRLGFSSKEMSSLLNISPKSVEISRYRFRKKLKMERDDNLVHYIQSM